MIDTENLCTASLYINNQLVSRGLLRDGQTIDFAQIACDGRGSATTAGRIISVVNDLILRRDRDAEHRESLSVAMRSLRAENLKHSNEIARLTEKNAEEKRRAEIASAAEAALRTQLKSAEAAARGQKEEIARFKTLVSQTRSACATEVRRRDRQIDTLKKQLAEAGRSRGSRANPSVTTIHVTGDMGAEKASPVRTGSTSNCERNLRDETNAFLAKLAHDLSEENETLLGVMQHTMAQLRDMSGCPEEERQESDVVKRPSCDELVAELASVTDHMHNILTNPSFVPIEEVMVREEEIGRLRSGWIRMESRWKEAVRLIEGWRKRMAVSGRPVCDEELKMGLRLSPVRVNEATEATEALDMGLSVVAEEAEEDDEIPHDSPCPPGHDRVELVPEAGSDDGDDFEENITILNRDSEMETPTEASRYQSSPDSSPLPEPPQLSPLRNSASAGNRGPLPGKRLRPRLGDFTTIVEEKTQELAAETKSMRSLPLRQRGSATEMPTRLPSSGHEPQERARSPSRTSLDEVLLAKPRPARSAASAEGRHGSGSGGLPEEEEEGDALASSDDDDDDDDQASSRPTSISAASRDTMPEKSPQLTMTTIAAKLAASEKEADAARVRAKLRAARSSRGGVARPTTTTTRTATASDAAAAAAAAGPPSSAPAVEDVDPVKHDLAPPPPPPPHQQLPPPSDNNNDNDNDNNEAPRPVEKRKRERRTNKAASRRRSTLSPWELQALMSGGSAS